MIFWTFISLRHKIRLIAMCAIGIYPKIYISNIFWPSKLLLKKIYVLSLWIMQKQRKRFHVSLKTRMSLQSLVIQNWQITDQNTIRDVKINTVVPSKGNIPRSWQKGSSSTRAEIVEKLIIEGWRPSIMCFSLNQWFS